MAYDKNPDWGRAGFLKQPEVREAIEALERVAQRAKENAEKVRQQQNPQDQ